MKMSEIFDLPITGREFYNLVSDDDTTAEEDIAIANCINHADALADALASVLEACFSKSGVTTDVAASAVEVLKAYVGEGK